MPTIREHLDKVIEKVTNFHPIDELSIPDEFIYKKMCDVRATLIRDLYRRKENLERFYQYSVCNTVKCVERQCTIDGVTFNLEKPVYILNLENIIEGIGSKNINFLGNEEGMAYSKVSLRSFLKHGCLRHAGGLPVYTFIGGKAMIKNLNTSGHMLVSVNAIYYDPREDCAFDTEKTHFPVPSEYNLELLTAKDILSSQGIFIDDVANLKDDRIVSAQEQISQQAATHEQQKDKDE